MMHRLPLLCLTILVVVSVWRPPGMRAQEGDIERAEVPLQDLDTQDSDSATTRDAAAATPTTTKKSKVHLYIMRHAQGEHNVRGVHIPDAPLTALGQLQAKEIGQVLFNTNNKANNSAFPRPPDVIFASPLKRTLQTTFGAFDTQREWKQAHAMSKVVLLSELQELHDKPCDIGVDLETLEKSFPQLSTTGDSNVNTSLVIPGWYHKGPAPDDEVRGAKRGQLLHEKLQTLLRERVLFAQEESKRPIKSVLLVTHGGIMRHFLWQGSLSLKTFKHAEVIRCEYEVDLAADPPNPAGRPECSLEPFALPQHISS